MRCFYDADEQIELWGKYLAKELPAIYSERAATVVVFVSTEYADRDWTRLESAGIIGPKVARSATVSREWHLDLGLVLRFALGHTPA